MKKHLLALLLLTGTACAPRSIESYHTAESDEEIVRLLNDRAYEKAVWLIESHDGKKPADKNRAFLLGQAYLGKAGLEPLRLGTRVIGPQPSTTEQNEILPDCPSGELGAVGDADPLCLLKRVYFNVPDADRYEMARARELFRYAYPEPAESPEWVNVLVGAVETASVVKRLGSMFLLARQTAREQSTPSDEKLRAFARNLKLMFEETEQAFHRAEHSGNKISQLLTGKSGAVWFKRVEQVVHWVDKLGLGPLFDILRQNGLSDEENRRYGDMLDKIREYLDEQNSRIAATRP